MKKNFYRSYFDTKFLTEFHSVRAVGKILFLLPLMTFWPTHTRIYRLDTKQSHYEYLRNALCNYDDEKKTVICNKLSLSDPNSIETIVVSEKEGAYEECGNEMGKKLIGVFYRERFEKPSNNNRGALNQKDIKIKYPCSVWTEHAFSPPAK